MQRLISVLTLATLSLGVFPAAKLMAVVIPPIGLAPGSQYQLVFVTAGARDATSSNIADYNAFVTAEAALNPLLPGDATWHAVAVTPSLNAVDNAASGGLPVYNTQGIEVAAAATGLYAFNLLNPIAFDQFGNANNGVVWTGMVDTGGFFIHYPLGADNDIPGLDQPSSVIGNSAVTHEGWADAGFAPLTALLPLYALSTPITVPTPEPSTFALLGVAILIVGGQRLFRRRRNR